MLKCATVPSSRSIVLSSRRKKPCPPLAGESYKTFAEYEKRMNLIRRDTESGTLLEGQDCAYAFAYLRYHFEWERYLAQHGEPECISVEWNERVHAYSSKKDQNQLWVHYEDGEFEVFSYKICHSSFGCDTTQPGYLRDYKIRQIKVAARCIISSDTIRLKELSKKTGPVDVHHDKVSFDSLLFGWLKNEVGVKSLSTISVVDIGNEGIKSFHPASLAKSWYDFHGKNAALVVMSKDDHRQWHKENSEGSDCDWSVFDD